MKTFTRDCLRSTSWIALLKTMPLFTNSNYGNVILKTAQELGRLGIDVR